MKVIQIIETFGKAYSIESEVKINSIKHVARNLGYAGGVLRFDLKDATKLRRTIGPYAFSKWLDSIVASYAYGADWNLA